MDEEEVFGLPPATVSALPSVVKPPENAVTVKSCVNLRKETVNFLSESGLLQFSFDSLEPCLVKLKWNAPFVSCNYLNLTVVETLICPHRLSLSLLV